MPRFDGTGPWGLGPGTGWGLGPCGAGRAWGRPWGRAPRFSGFSRYPFYPTSAKEEKEWLENELKFLEEEMKEIKTRLNELKDQK